LTFLSRFIIAHFIEDFPPKITETQKSQGLLFNYTYVSENKNNPWHMAGARINV